MTNCESNRNGWKDGKSKCNYCDKKEDSCYCELKDSHCKNDEHKYEYDCHKKDYKDKEHECNNQDKKEECCCKKSMKEALELLSSNKLKSNIKFDEFVFIGQKFLVGANIREDLVGNDNINNPNVFGAQFKGFEDCNCDLIKLFADQAFYPIPNNNATQVDIPDFNNIHYASLCDIQAVVFNYDGNQTDFENDLTKSLDEFNNKCKVKCDECCCNKGVFSKIFNPCNPINTVSLTAGWLAVKNAKILGKIGNILVLSNVGTKRIYFICLDSVGFISF